MWVIVFRYLGEADTAHAIGVAAPTPGPRLEDITPHEFRIGLRYDLLVRYRVIVVERWWVSIATRNSGTAGHGLGLDPPATSLSCSA